MHIHLIFVLFFHLSLKSLLTAYPTKDSSKDRNEASYVTVDTTTEVGNATKNIISSVWNKISNIFSAETTTQEESGTRHEVLMPEDRIPAIANNDRPFRMVPLDFSRRGQEGDSGGEGNLFPIHHQQLMRRSDLEEIPEEGSEQRAEEVRSRESTKRDNVLRVRAKRTTHLMTKKPISIIVEEFDQGNIEGGRIKRWKDSEKSTDWKTEKIVVGSDAVENLDKENYIEESKNIDFPFHSLTIRPIIIEDSLSQEISTLSQKELPPLKIIEF